MQTPEGLQNAVTLVLENMAQDGVIYAELRFAPQFHTLGGMTQEQAVQAAVAGLKNAPIPGNLILCCMRGEGNEKANEEIKRLREEQDQIEGVQAKLVDGPFEIEEGGKIKSDNAFVSRYDGKWIVYPKESITRTENDTIVISYEEGNSRKMKLYKYVGSFNGMNLNPKKQ